eukprot:g2727.t1
MGNKMTAKIFLSFLLTLITVKGGDGDKIPDALRVKRLEKIQAKIDRLKRDAEECTADGRLEKALEHYDRAIEVQTFHKPDDLGGTHYKRAQIFERLNRLDEALITYDEAIHVNPAHGDTWINRGGVLFEVGREAEAAQSWEHALELGAMSEEDSADFREEIASIREAAMKRNSLIRKQSHFRSQVFAFLLVHSYNTKLISKSEQKKIIDESEQHFEDERIEEFWELLSDRYGVEAPLSEKLSPKETRKQYEVVDETTGKRKPRETDIGPPRRYKPLPRYTLDEVLQDPVLVSGSVPFVITDAINDWEIFKVFASDPENSFSLLQQFLPESIVDFYPQNLAQVKKRSPYIINMKKYFTWSTENRESAISMSETRTNREILSKSQYAMWRTTLDEWRMFRILMEPMPSWIAPEEHWIHNVIDKKSQMENLHGALRWKMMLLGERFSSMFFHKDDFATATLQVQFVGRKRWIVCKDDQGLDPDINTYDPDHEKWPLFQEAKCWDTIALPGDILYYPTFTWHHTLNLDTPSIGFAGRRIDESNWMKTLSQINYACKNPGIDTTKDFPGSAPNLSKDTCKNLPRFVKSWSVLDWKNLYNGNNERFVNYNRKLHRLGFTNLLFEGFGKGKK